jgi:hypothetical protein
MKAYVEIHIFLTSALVGGEWSASRPDRFTPGTHWTWRKFLTLQDSNSDPSVVQAAANRYSDRAITAPSQDNKVTNLVVVGRYKFRILAPSLR